MSRHMAEQGRLRYNYRFNFVSTIPGETKDEPEKNELQAYINEVLGLESKKSEKNRVSS